MKKIIPMLSLLTLGTIQTVSNNRINIQQIDALNLNLNVKDINKNATDIKPETNNIKNNYDITNQFKLLLNQLKDKHYKIISYQYQQPEQYDSYFSNNIQQKLNNLTLNSAILNTVNALNPWQKIDSLSDLKNIFMVNNKNIQAGDIIVFTDDSTALANGNSEYYTTDLKSVDNSVLPVITKDTLENNLNIDSKDYLGQIKQYKYLYFGFDPAGENKHHEWKATPALLGSNDALHYHMIGEFPQLGNLRDGDIIKSGKTYYLIGTLDAFSTEDFKHFDHIDLGGIHNNNYYDIWAPEFFKDIQGKIHIIYCAKKKGQNFSQTYVADFDLAHQKVTNPYQKVNCSYGIDPHIAVMNGKYYLWHSYSNNYFPQVADNYLGKYTDVKTNLTPPKRPSWYEGGFSLDSPGTHYLYKDYITSRVPGVHDSGDMVVQTSYGDNYNTWLPQQKVQAPINMRHGSFLINPDYQEQKGAQETTLNTLHKKIAYVLKPFGTKGTLSNDNSISITVDHTYKNVSENKEGIRNVTYEDAPKSIDPIKQIVYFHRTNTVDQVTNEITHSTNWQATDRSDEWSTVPIPTFTGYTASIKNIPATKATVGVTNLNVKYNRNKQHAKLMVHDDVTNTDLTNYTENSTGLYQDQISFKTAPSAVEQELKDKGYTIVSDSFKDSPTYNADDSKNNFVIHVTHKIVPVTPDQPKKPTDIIPDTKQHYPTGVNINDLNKDVQRSIFYKYEDNTQAEPTVVQKAHFDRTVKVDAVTQKIVDNGTWATKDNYPEVTTKSIDGYTPDKTKVDSATPSMINNQDQTVVYHANDEDAAITYIDDTTGKVLKTDTQKAKYKQTIKFATDPNTQIQTYKDQGYVLVTSDWKNGSTYQTDPTKNKFTVHLKHGTSTVTPDKPKKSTDIIPGTKQHYPTGVDTNDLNQLQQRQITYTYADSKKQASPIVTQKATFHRTATVDNITGKTTYTDWTTSDQYPEVKSPTIEGYTPDKITIPKLLGPELNSNVTVHVTYKPDPESVRIVAQTTNGKTLISTILHGLYNTEFKSEAPIVKGYHLTNISGNTAGTYQTDNKPVIYTFTANHTAVPVQHDYIAKPDSDTYPSDLNPDIKAKVLPETGTININTELKSVINIVLKDIL